MQMEQIVGNNFANKNNKPAVSGFIVLYIYGYVLTIYIHMAILHQLINDFRLLS